MKRTLLLLTFISTSLIAQTSQKLNAKIESIRTEVSETKSILNSLQEQINKVVTQNNYLKKVLEINNPVLEQEKGGTLFKITKVIGNKKEQNITISILLETKDKFKVFSLENIYIIDLEGNKIDTYPEYRDAHGELELNTPRKSMITFKYKTIENRALLNNYR